MRIFILFIFFMSFSIAQDSIKAAIDPNPTGKNMINIDEATEKTIKDGIENALVNLRVKVKRKQKSVFTVVARGDDLKKQLEEQDFQVTSGCTPADCAAEIGQILNVDYMLLPTVINTDPLKASNVYRGPLRSAESPEKVSVSLKLINVETAEVVSSVEERTIPLCSIAYKNDLLEEMVSELYNNSNQTGGIRGSNKAIKIVKSSVPQCAKTIIDLEKTSKEDDGSSNNLLMIGGLLLLLLIGAASGGGGDGGSPSGGVDIGITVP